MKKPLHSSIITITISLIIIFIGCKKQTPLPDCYKHAVNRILDSNDPLSITYQNESKRLILLEKPKNLRYVFKSVIKIENQNKLLLDVRGIDFCSDRIFILNKKNEKNLLELLKTKKYPDELEEVKWQIVNQDLEILEVE